ncbi:MAG: peptidoglycan bridge formation glycyltransferase FemA/FemB family protein [Bacteroidales bacterium]|jgi:hypothetical protein
MPLITPDNNIWKSLAVKYPNDFYCLPEYASLEAEHIKGKPLAWYFKKNDSEMLFPLIDREIPNIKKHDLISPYGYTGFCGNNINKDFFSEAIENFNKEACNNNYFTSFVRLHPFNNCVKNFEPNKYIVKRDDIAYIPLNKSLETIQKGFSKNHKRNINKLLSDNYSVKHNDYSFFDDFYKSYIRTMERNKAKSYYFFQSSYFTKLISILGDKMHFISVHSPEGKYVSGGLFSVFNNNMQYLFGGTEDDYVKNSPSKLMIHYAIILGKKLKAEYLCLGGGVDNSSEDGLFKFKLGFGSICQPFYTLHLIHKPEEYAKLDIEGDDFFPKYRRRGRY